VRAASTFIKPRRARSDAPCLFRFAGFDQHLGYWCAGPDLDRAGALHLRADPLHELAHGKDQAAILVQERRRPRQIQRMVLDGQRPLERANHRIRRAQRGRAPAGADRIEQIKNFFFANRHGHRNLCRIEIGKRCAQSPRLRHNAGDAKADVIGAFVAEHLWRHAWHGGAFDDRRAVGIDELLRQRREKPRRGRAEPDADDVHVHALAFDGRLICHEKLFYPVFFLKL